MASTTFIFDESEKKLIRYIDEQKDAEFLCTDWDIDLPEDGGPEEPPVHFADENGVICYSLTTSTDPNTYKGFIASFTKHMADGSVISMAAELVEWVSDEDEETEEN